MSRRYNKQPITSEVWDELYAYYLANKNNSSCFNYIFENITPYIEMCKKSFKVQPQYWDEYESSLIVNIWRAFNEFNPTKGAKFSTWVYRLAVQSAWGFIKNKCNEIDKGMNQDSIDDNDAFLQIESNYNNPEDSYITTEHERQVENSLHELLTSVLRGPIEYDVYIRKNGIMGCEKMSTEEIAADLNLTSRTVEQLITRNNNSMSNFKRFLKQNNYKTYNSSILKKYKQLCLK